MSSIILAAIIIVIVMILFSMRGREKYGFGEVNQPRILRGRFGPGGVIAGGILADMTHTFGPPWAPESCQLCPDCSVCPKCPQCIRDRE